MKIYEEHSKSLNPDAEEWRPIPQPSPLLPLAIIPPPPPPLKLHFQQRAYHYYFYTHLLQPPVYSISFPGIQFSLKAADEEKAEHFHHGLEMITEQENSSSDEEKQMVSPIGESRKCPRDFVKKGSRRDLPPRLRRALREAKKPPPPPSKQQWRHNKSRHGGATCSKLPVLGPPPKQEWKPKNKANTNIEVSGDGGAAASLPPSSSTSKTTIMIKNIPSQLRRDFMLKFLDGYCWRYSLEYDFLYLPIDFRRLGNLGYAFVNFTTAAAAMKFKNVLSNYKWRTIYTDEGEAIISGKVCEIVWARIQGKEALIRRFKKSSFNCNKLEFLPVVLDPPRNGSDPNPPLPVNLGRICRPPDH